MRYWLKMIGTSERPWNEPYLSTHVDFTCEPRLMRRGDIMVLYAVGGSMRVFALVEITSEFYDSGAARWPRRVSIDFEVNVPVPCGVHIDEVSTPERDLRLALRQQSYIELTPAEYENAATRLREVAASLLASSTEH